MCRQGPLKSVAGGSYQDYTLYAARSFVAVGCTVSCCSVNLSNVYDSLLVRYILNESRCWYVSRGGAGQYVAEFSVLLIIALINKEIFEIFACKIVL